MDKTVTQVLQEAAELLKSEGWAQGQYCLDGKLCAWGAISVACGAEISPSKRALYWPTNGSYNSSLELTAKAKVEEHLGLMKGGLPGWNDESGRTADDVINAICETAASLEEVSV